MRKWIPTNASDCLFVSGVDLLNLFDSIFMSAFGVGFVIDSINSCLNHSHICSCIGVSSSLVILFRCFLMCLSLIVFDIILIRFLLVNSAIHVNIFVFVRGGNGLFV